MDYLNLEKKQKTKKNKKKNRWKLRNTSKINFIYILNSGSKVDIDHKDNLEFLSQKELCSIILGHDF